MINCEWLLRLLPLLGVTLVNLASFWGMASSTSDHFNVRVCGGLGCQRSWRARFPLGVWKIHVSKNRTNVCVRNQRTLRFRHGRFAFVASFFGRPPSTIIFFAHEAGSLCQPFVWTHKKLAKDSQGRC